MVIKSLYDTIARLRNASNLHFNQINVRTSIFTLNILKVLYELGFILGFKVLNFKFTLVFLRFFNNFCSFRLLLLLSKPTRQLYVTYKQLKYFNFYKYNFNSFFLISTNYGILTDKQCINLKIGGKLILEVF